MANYHVPNIASVLKQDVGSVAVCEFRPFTEVALARLAVAVEVGLARVAVVADVAGTYCTQPWSRHLAIYAFVGYPSPSGGSPASSNVRFCPMTTNAGYHAYARRLASA
eukprot:IDg22949t1